MSDNQNQGQGQEPGLPRKRATYLSLIGVFAGLLGALVVRTKDDRRPDIKPFDLVLLGLATYRTGRVIALDQVTEPLRAPVAETTDDGPQPKGTGVQRAFGELITCPTCIGTWVAAALTLALQLAPGPTRAFMAMMAASGLAEVLDYATGALDNATR